MYFHTKVKFLRQTDNGLIKQIKEEYLIDAMSFTEAEARVLQEVGEGMREVTVDAITRSPIKEVVMYGDTDLWCKCKVTYSLMDEESEKEKKVTTYLLINANDTKEAYERCCEHLKEMLVPYEIPKIEETKIIEIYEYEKRAPLGFKKVSSTETTGDKASELEEHYLGSRENPVTKVTLSYKGKTLEIEPDFKEKCNAAMVHGNGPKIAAMRDDVAKEFEDSEGDVGDEYDSARRSILKLTEAQKTSLYAFAFNPTDYGVDEICRITGLSEEDLDFAVDYIQRESNGTLGEPEDDDFGDGGDLPDEAYDEMQNLDFDASSWYESLDVYQKQDLANEFNRRDAEFWLRSHGLDLAQANEVITWLEEGVEHEEACAFEDNAVEGVNPLFQPLCSALQNLHPKPIGEKTGRQLGYFPKPIDVLDQNSTLPDDSKLKVDPTQGQAVAFDAGIVGLLSELGLDDFNIGQIERITENAKLPLAEFQSWANAVHDICARHANQIWEHLRAEV